MKAARPEASRARKAITESEERALVALQALCLYKEAAFGRPRAALRTGAREIASYAGPLDRIRRQRG